MKKRDFATGALLGLLLAGFLAVPAAAGAGMDDATVRRVLRALGIIDATDVFTAGSGDITSVVAGNGLTGGATSGAATVNVAVSAGLTAAADEITLDTDLQAIAALSGVRGDVIFYGASGWTRLGTGTAGQVLESGGAGADPAWGTDGGGSAGPWISWNASQGVAPTSAFATFSTRNNHSVLAFDADTDESTIFEGTLDSGYASGDNLSITVYWAGASATTGDVVWTVEVEYVDDGTLDTDADSFDTAQSATTTTSGTTGVVVATTYALANADVDGIAAGNPFRLRVTRDANAAGDTMTGDAQLFRAVVSQ